MTHSTRPAALAVASIEKHRHSVPSLPSVIVSVTARAELAAALDDLKAFWNETQRGTTPATHETAKHFYAAQTRIESAMGKL